MMKKRQAAAICRLRQKEGVILRENADGDICADMVC